jgi:hypothetical protein
VDGGGGEGVVARDGDTRTCDGERARGRRQSSRRGVFKEIDQIA